MGEAGTWSKGKFIRAIQTYTRTFFLGVAWHKSFFCGSAYSPASGESLIPNRIIRVGIETGISFLLTQIKVYIYTSMYHVYYMPNFRGRRLQWKIFTKVKGVKRSNLLDCEVSIDDQASNAISCSLMTL